MPNVPYVSQIDSGRPNNDCGPACALMVAWAYGQSAAQTIDLIYRDYGLPDTGLYVSTIARVLRGLGVENERHTGSLPELRQWLDEGRPAVLLVDYAPVVIAGLYQYAYYGGHFVVATGYTASAIRVNDPYGRGDWGHNIEWPNSVMEAAWRPHDQYNYTAIVPLAPLDLHTDPVQVPGADEETESMDHREALEQIRALADEALGAPPDDGGELPVYATTTGLNLRQGPGTNYAVLRALAKGEQVYQVSDDYDPWWQVQALKDHAVGYSHSDYLRPT